MKRKTTLLLSFTILLLSVGELVGRYIGLTSYPVYIESSKFEYILKPNQNTLIYRNRVFTNEYSMRSKPLTPTDTSVVLLIGDSIIHGGNLTDQDSLATTILENNVTHTLHRNIRILNISAKSWGPDNGVAYLKEYGLFNADMIVLVVSSHDAFDNMTFRKTVGTSPDHPAKNTLLAWQMFVKKGLPRIPFLQNLFHETQPSFRDTVLNSNVFNTGFRDFQEISKKNNIPLIIYLHSSTSEIDSHKLVGGGLKIIDFCHQNQIPIIIGLGKEKPQFYEDGLHFNNQGQKFLANTLFPFILERIE